MKVYLLNPPFVPNFVRCGRWQGVTARGGGLDYPKWLAYATGVLEQHFFECRLVDAPAFGWSRKDTIEDIVNFRPDVLVVETNFSSVSNDIKVCSEVKMNMPKLIIVLVGPPVAVFGERLLKENIDIIAKYEYEYTLLDICKSIVNGDTLDSVLGISYKNNNGKIITNSDRLFCSSLDLDSMPFVSSIYKKHLDIKKYSLSQSLYPEVQIFTGRGCPFLCSFCSWPENMMGRKNRTRSIDNIISELDYIKNKLPEVKEVFFEDDTFTINENRVNEFCDKIFSKGMKITWSCNTRATLSYKTLRLMKRAGCRLLIVGYESGDDNILKQIKKGINTEQMKSFTKDAKEAGLIIHGDFIIGLPQETKESVKKTYDFIKQVRPHVLQVAVATPIPGTSFYNWAKEQGYLLTENLENSIDGSGYQKCIVSYPAFSSKNIEQAVDNYNGPRK